MNLPNRLTLSRIVMIPIFVALLEVAYFDFARPARVWMCTAALVLFIIAAITDLIDGMLARRWNLVTDFGKLFDPLADKLLVTAALVIFVRHGLFGAWVVVVILCREFIVTGLRSLGERDGRTIPADRWGKIKTITQIVAIIYCLVHLVAEAAGISSQAWSDLWTGGLGKWSRVVLDVLVTVCLVATVASGVTYLRNNWDLVSEREM